jgi:hypothetical protein
MTCTAIKIRFAVVNMDTRTIDKVFNTYMEANFYYLNLPTRFTIISCSDEQLQDWAYHGFIVPADCM